MYENYFWISLAAMFIELLQTMTLALIGNVYGSKLRVASLSTCSCFVKFASSSEFWILSSGLFCC